MDLKKVVYKLIKDENLIPDGSNVVLGLSGGPDSVTLLHILKDLALDYRKTKGKFGLDIKIYPVHVNHKFRPGDAELDQAYAEELCEKMYEETEGLVNKCRTFVIDCNALSEKLGTGSEEAGRIARYESFLKVCREVEKPVIAVAQNANDQAETVLFRILRGSSLDGLSGIAIKRYEENVPVVRPLLNTGRDAIEKYIAENDITPRIDKTNLEPLYQRNKIRLNLLPELKEYNPNIVETLDRMAYSFSMDKDYLDSVAKEALYKAELPDGSLDTKVLANLHKSIRLRVYNLKLKNIGMTSDMTFKGLLAIDEVRIALNHKEPVAELPDGYSVSRINKKLVFHTKNTPKNTYNC